MYVDIEQRQDNLPLPCFPNNQRLTESAIHRERWMQRYIVLILNRYLPWYTPLDVACNFAVRLREDLNRIYDDPLLRICIEKMYLRRSKNLYAYQAVKKKR